MLYFYDLNVSWEVDYQKAFLPKISLFVVTVRLIIALGVAKFTVLQPYTTQSGGVVSKLQDYIHLSCHASKTPPDPQLSVRTLNCRQNLILHHPIFHENHHFQG